jgi:hypothetical protein
MTQETPTMTTTRDFRLDDVVVGRSVMTGINTRGKRATGTVIRVLPGIGFRVDDGVQPSMLWRELELHAPRDDDVIRPPETAVVRDEDGWLPPPPELRRTDSGADVGRIGFPDCVFWEQQGVEPLFVALRRDYSAPAPAPASTTDDLPSPALRHHLEQHRDHLETEGPYRRAWNRQWSRVAATAITTPPRTADSPVAPGAPARLRFRGPAHEDSGDDADTEEGPAPLNIPNLDDHRGCGILAGDFIKPDPALTQREARNYIRDELRQWLTGRIVSHAREIGAAGLRRADIAEDVEAGLWPAGRLYLLAAALDDSGWTAAVGREPADYDERYSLAADFAVDICLLDVLDQTVVIPGAISRLAAGFVSTDRLPDGRTVEYYWNRSPFEPLRSAPPLPDHEPTLMEQPLTLKATLPLRMWMLMGLGVIGYTWMVAYLLGARGRV